MSALLQDQLDYFQVRYRNEWNIVFIEDDVFVARPYSKSNIYS